MGPILLTWLTLIATWISNNIHYKVWGKITYPPPNLHRWSLGTDDDVIKWKHFRWYWPFVRGIHRSRITSHRVVETQVIWDAMVEVWEWISHFISTFYWACGYLSMLAVKFTYVSKRGSWPLRNMMVNFRVQFYKMLYWLITWAFQRTCR